MNASAEADGTPGTLNGATRTTGIIGWPVTTSRSPAIHNAAFAATGLDWVYLPLPVVPGRLPQALEGLRSLGFSGANVTMPHKAASAELADELSEDARRLNAVNTLVLRDGALRGENTDAPGFGHFLERDAGVDARGKSAILIGAGGAARAVALALEAAGLATLTVAARDRGKALAIADLVTDPGTRVVVIGLDRLEGASADLVVNATPIGTDGRSAPPIPDLGPGITVVDLVTHPNVTPLVTAATDAGAVAFGGLGMLLRQAALSFELWTGVEAPFDVMSEAAKAPRGR
jgi:shikimate dehydrogenase